MTKVKEKYIMNEKGRKESVILDVATYEDLKDDLEDLYSIAERKKEKSISLESVKKSLKKSGIL